MRSKVVVVRPTEIGTEVLVRVWENGDVEVDERRNPGDIWRPIQLVGGSFRVEDQGEPDEAD